jgi:hypothetical protein
MQLANAWQSTFRAVRVTARRRAASAPQLLDLAQQVQHERGAGHADSEVTLQAQCGTRAQQRVAAERPILRRPTGRLYHALVDQRDQLTSLGRAGAAQVGQGESKVLLDDDAIDDKASIVSHFVSHCSCLPCGAGVETGEGASQRGAGLLPGVGDGGRRHDVQHHVHVARRVARQPLALEAQIGAGRRAARDAELDLALRRGCGHSRAERRLPGGDREIE